MAVWSEATTTEILATRRIDAEFSQPKYLEAERKTRSCKAENLGNLGTFVPGPFGSSFRVSNYDFQSPYRYIRGQDVKPFFILEDDSRFIPQADFIRLQHYAVKNDDLMISVVGTLGNVAVCTERVTPAMFSCKSTIFRSEKGDPYYLLAYLNSHFGQLCLLRRQRGAIQMGLNIEDLRSIPIPRLGEYEEGRIAEKVRKAHDELISSRESYQSAQQLLESELGLDKLSFQKPVGYTAQFSELELSRRLDAQHYQAQFTQLLAHLANFPTRKIRDIRTCNRRGIQPIYERDGAYDVINSQHLGPKHINYDGLEKTSPQAFSASPVAHIRQNDLLIYTTGAYIGRTNVYLSNAPAFASNHVNILRVTPDIDAAYMAMIFQSVVGQFQTQKHSRGSAQAELYPNDIDKFVVPILPFEQQTIIGDLVRESLVKQRESARLLEQAKTRVEQLIEEAVNS
ncbi:MAG: hypothetical protein KGZ88_05260 [Methylomicrobium sp.]|nr:hypothetical protein [Methylomicrobium sp.]